MPYPGQVEPRQDRASQDRLCQPRPGLVRTKSRQAGPGQTRSGTSQGRVRISPRPEPGPAMTIDRPEPGKFGRRRWVIQGQKLVRHYQAQLGPRPDQGAVSDSQPSSPTPSQCQPEQSHPALDPGSAWSPPGSDWTYLGSGLLSSHSSGTMAGQGQQGRPVHYS